jgi:hypothetical protein
LPQFGRTKEKNAMPGLYDDGAYRTIDLTRLGWSRVPEGRPYAERGII